MRESVLFTSSLVICNALMACLFSVNSQQTHPLQAVVVFTIMNLLFGLSHWSLCYNDYRRGIQEGKEISQQEAQRRYISIQKRQTR